MGQRFSHKSPGWRVAAWAAAAAAVIAVIAAIAAIAPIAASSCGSVVIPPRALLLFSQLVHSTHPSNA